VFDQVEKIPDGGGIVGESPLHWYLELNVAMGDIAVLSPRRSCESGFDIDVTGADG